MIQMSMVKKCTSSAGDTSIASCPLGYSDARVCFLVFPTRIDLHWQCLKQEYCPAVGCRARVFRFFVN